MGINFHKLNPLELFQKGTNLISLIMTVIDGVQAIKNASGADKKARVLDVLASGEQGIEDLIGKDAFNDPALKEAASNLVDAIVAFKKAYAAAHVAVNKG